MNTVKDGWRTASVKKVVWAIKQPAGHVVVFSPICPHLGCGSRWDVDDKTFKCPCHGSVYDATGKVLARPTQRPLDVLPSKAEDGRLFILGLLLLPFLDRNPERRPSSRPVALLAGTAFLVIIFTLLGISIRDLHALPKLDPSVARGKSLFAKNHCIACHGLHGEGGKVGPDLSYVGNRRTDRNWHIRHLRDPASVSPGSLMPKFPLPDREMNDLVSYLLSLKGSAAAPAEGRYETDETEYALLPYVGALFSCLACVEPEERKEQI